MRILCVCLGNICRSPTAEAVLRKLGGGRVRVDSAGTGDWSIGQPPHGAALRAAARRGYDLSGLRARQVTARDFSDFDLILAMDAEVLTDLEALRPEGSATPVRLFLGDGGVPDPYFTGDFDGALDLIEGAAQGILAQLT